MACLVCFYENTLCTICDLILSHCESESLWLWYVHYLKSCDNYLLFSWGNWCICLTESDVEEKEPPAKKEKEKPHKKKEKGYKTFEQEVSMESDEER